MDKTIIIGLTGPTGAGKSSLGDVFAEYGCEVIDCDRLAREAVEPGMPALGRLVGSFGRSILRPDGSLDRKALAALAFPTEEGRERLNAIVHPAVIALLEERIAASGARGVVIDAPLLYESGLDRRCDCVIAVVAPDEARRERIMRRDGISSQAAALRMGAQPECGRYADKASCVIVNDGDARQFFERARAVLENIFGGDASR